MKNGIFLTSQDVQKIMDCRSTKASTILKKCNQYTVAQKRDVLLPGRGRCYLAAFCQLTGIPKKEVLEALEEVRV